ncbi:MAG: ThuA domain-containing protein [Pirellulales bacterium]
MMNRREMLQSTAAAAGLLLPLSSASLASTPKKCRLLYFTRTVGREHVVIRSEGGAPSYSDRALTAMCSRAGYELECSKDGRIFDGDLDQFDGFIFFTNGDLTLPNEQDTPPMSERGKERFLSAVAEGKGFVGVHGSSGSWRTAEPKQNEAPIVDPYIAMLGGEFLAHGKIQYATLSVTSPKFPGMNGLRSPLRLEEEWYALKNLSRDMHIILMLNTEGMNGTCYRRPNYPVAWARKQNRGRVFYTALGHAQDTWDSKVFEQMLMGGVAWAIGDVAFEPVMNFEQLTPNGNVLQG